VWRSKLPLLAYDDPSELPRTLSLGFERVNGRAWRNEKGAGFGAGPLVEKPDYI
jgi:hypothetical protein